MMRFVFFLVGGVLISVLPVGQLAAQKVIISDPNVEERAVAGFHGIDVSNAIDLYMSQGDQETVAVSAADVKWRDKIHTDVVGGILKIWLDTKGWAWSRVNKKMKAYISFTLLDELRASGASDVYVDGVISGTKLSIRLSGASDFKGAVKVAELTIDQSGASDAHIAGTVAGLTTIQSSGASDVKGYDLTTQDCDAHASGASDIHITVTRQLSASASGASTVYYRGDGVIRESHASGASTISKN